MVKLIVGKKGSGKTKSLIESVHSALETEKGNVIFICNGDRHFLDLNHSIRLIDVEKYDTGDYRVFKSFILGSLSQNYDITAVFIDSLFKIVEEDKENLEEFISSLDKISNEMNITFTICISADKSELPEGIHCYIIN